MLLGRLFANPMLLEGKVAVVTGGGRGIGRAIAKRFAAEGAAVLLASRTEAELRSVTKEIEQARGKAAWVVADVSREADCARIVAGAEEHLGPVSILVNNAGDYGPVKPVEEISPEEWDRVIAVHLRGAFLLMRLMLPGMYAAAVRRDREYLQPFRQSCILVGLSLRCGKSGDAGSNTRGCGGSRAARRARKCDLSGSSHGNEDVQGSRKCAGGSTERESGTTTEAISGGNSARPGTNGG